MPDKTWKQTAELLRHVIKGETHLIPSKALVTKKLQELEIEWLQSGDNETWFKVQDLIIPEIAEEMNEWLRVQMFNLRRQIPLRGR